VPDVWASVESEKKGRRNVKKKAALLAETIMGPTHAAV